MNRLKLIAAVALLALATGTARQATRDIYPDPGQAKADVAAALKTAAATHKRILLDFGGNWCGDCQVLDIYFHDPANRPILDASFVLVHVNIGMEGKTSATHRTARPGPRNDKIKPSASETQV